MNTLTGSAFVIIVAIVASIFYLLVITFLPNPDKKIPTDTPKIQTNIITSSVTNGLIVIDNGLSRWNTPSSKFGQWMYRSIRINYNGSKYIPEFNLNEPYEITSTTNITPKWNALFDCDGFTDLSTCQWKIRQAFEIKKEINDAFQFTPSENSHNTSTNLGCSSNSIVSIHTNMCSQITSKTNVPPGFKLQKNNNGEYRACYNSGCEIYNLSGDNTKQGAIDRALEQYNYIHKDDNVKWEDVK